MTDKKRFIHIPKCGGTSIKHALGIKTGHQTLQSLDDSMKFKDLREYFIFTFIRNPFDRMASFYRNIYAVNRDAIKDDKIPFQDWFYKALVENEYPYYYRAEFFAPSYEWLTIDNKLEVNFVGKLESIEDDFKKLCSILKVDAQLPHKNPTEDKGNEVYTSEMKDIMYTLFEKDFKTWYSNY